MAADPNLASCYAKFEATILDPIGAGAIQRQECRRAFYVGAAAAFKLVLEASEHEEPVAVLMVDAISQELEAFSSAIGTERE